MRHLIGLLPELLCAVFAAVAGVLFRRLSGSYKQLAEVARAELTRSMAARQLLRPVVTGEDPADPIANDDTALGSILRAGGLIGAADLARAVERRQHDDRPLGELLVAAKALSREQLEHALQLQQDLRRGGRRKRALAQAALAASSSTAVVRAARQVRQRSRSQELDLTPPTALAGADTLPVIREQVE